MEGARVGEETSISSGNRGVRNYKGMIVIATRAPSII